MKPDGPRGRWFRRHPRKTLLGSSVLGTIVLLALAEGASRLLFPAWAPTHAERAGFWAYDELLGWAHRPGQEGRLVHPDFSVEVRISSQGLRDAEYSYERTSKKRMLVLGDSFGWGFGVEHDEVFSEILERRHPDWEVINASVSGYGTDQQLLYLDRRGRRFAPDAVLLLFHNSDFENNTSGVQYWHNKPFFALDEDRVMLKNHPVPGPTLKQRLDRFFIGKTYLLSRLYRPTLGRLAWRHPGDRVDRGSYGSVEYKELMARRLLGEIHDRCREMEARFLLVSGPLLPRGRETLEDWSRRAGVQHLALDTHLAAAARELSVEFPHDRHWNPAGHAVVAGAIEEFLRSIRVFDP
jgi:hypothetical protein